MLIYGKKYRLFRTKFNPMLNILNYILNSKDIFNSVKSGDNLNHVKTAPSLLNSQKAMYASGTSASPAA